MADETTFAIVIAAGGDGRRMGGRKPQRLLCGVSLLDRALKFSFSLTHNVAIAIRRGTELDIKTDAVILTDSARNGGPLSELMSGLDWGAQLGVDHILMIGCDMPFLPQGLIRRLNNGQAGKVTIAVSGNRLHPACALWPVAARTIIGKYGASGKRSLIGFAEAIGYDRVEWLIQAFDPFFNVNSPEDMIRAETILDQNSRI